MHHIIFIHSSTDGLLGCFHVLFANGAAVNTGMCVSFQIKVFIFSGYMPRSGIAESYGSSTFNFLRNSILFFTAGPSFYSLINSVQVGSFSYILSNCCFLVLFAGILMEVRWYLIVGLIWVSLMMLSIFSCASALLVYLLWRQRISSKPSAHKGFVVDEL